MKPEFNQVVKDYIKLVYHFSLQRIEKNEVDDIVGNTFLKAFKAYDDFHYTSDNQLKSWLLTICHNTIKDSYKKVLPVSMNQEDIEQTETQNNPQELLEATIETEEVESVYKSIKQLDSVDQECVKLRVLEEMSFKEIAAIFSISEHATKMRFYRAVRSLRRII